MKVEIPLPSSEMLTSASQCLGIAATILLSLRYGGKYFLNQYRQQLLNAEEKEISEGKETQVARIIRKAVGNTVDEKLDHLHDCLHRIEEQSRRDVDVLALKLQNVVDGQQALGRQIEQLRADRL